MAATPGEKIGAEDLNIRFIYLNVCFNQQLWL
jgi:hypothetical protein